MHWDIQCDDVQRCNIKVLSVLLERLSARDAVGSAVVVAVVVLGVEAALAICCILSICQLLYYNAHRTAISLVEVHTTLKHHVLVLGAIDPLFRTAAE